MNQADYLLLFFCLFFIKRKEVKIKRNHVEVVVRLILGKGKACVLPPHFGYSGRIFDSADMY